jgi:hypothetical protein
MPWGQAPGVEAVHLDDLAGAFCLDVAGLSVDATSDLASTTDLSCSGMLSK